MPDCKDYLEQTAALHDHLCPRQVLGVRIGIHAGELLGLPLPRRDKRILAFVETDGCFADGVSVATGCRMGRRTMRLMDYGKVAAVFIDTETEQAVRIAPTREAREGACLYAPDAPDRWHARRDAYQRMPTSELLDAKFVTLTFSLQDIISQPGLRVPCNMCGEEIMNVREVVVGGNVLCQWCAGEGYYVMRDA